MCVCMCVPAPKKKSILDTTKARREGGYDGGMMLHLYYILLLVFQECDVCVCVCARARTCCVCVCERARVRVCVCERVRVCMHVLYLCTRACVVCVRAHVVVCVCVRVRDRWMDGSMDRQMDLWMD